MCVLLNNRKMRIAALLLVSLTIAALLTVGSRSAQTEAMSEVGPQRTPSGNKTLVVAGGCFWCIEAMFEELRGVISVESGYAGGSKPNVTYEEVSSGMTGHAEVAKITFDSGVISTSDLLSIFFAAHDPTTLNRQGPDSGTQYRSAIFYSTPDEKALAERIRIAVAKERIWPNPIVTTIEPLKNYTPAEGYHQNYFGKYERAGTMERMKMNPGYCAAIIEPKVIKFRKKYADRLKKRA